MAVISKEEIENIAYEYSRENAPINISTIFFDIQSIEGMQKYTDEEIEEVSKAVYEEMQMLKTEEEERKEKE